MREVRQFFGDAEHVFKLDPGMIVALEKVAGAGIGAIGRRFFGAEFTHGDLVGVLRLGLIGGGMDPKDAADLVTTYADKMSVVALYEAALPIVEAVFFDPEPVKDGVSLSNKTEAPANV